MAWGEYDFIRASCDGFFRRIFLENLNAPSIEFILLLYLGKVRRLVKELLKVIYKFRIKLLVKDEMKPFRIDFVWNRLMFMIFELNNLW